MIKLRKYKINNTTYNSRYSILFDDLLPSLNEVAEYEINDKRIIRFDIKLHQTEFSELFKFNGYNSHLTKNFYIQLGQYIK